MILCGASRDGTELSGALLLDLFSRWSCCLAREMNRGLTQHLRTQRAFHSSTFDSPPQPCLPPKTNRTGGRNGFAPPERVGDGAHVTKLPNAVTESSRRASRTSVGPIASTLQCQILLARTVGRFESDADGSQTRSAKEMPDSPSAWPAQDEVGLARVPSERRELIKVRFPHKRSEAPCASCKRSKGMALSADPSVLMPPQFVVSGMSPTNVEDASSMVRLCALYHHGRRESSTCAFPTSI